MLNKLFLTIVLFLPSMCSAGTLYVVASNNLKGKSYSQAEVKRILLGEITSLQNARVNLIYPSYSSPEIQTLSKFVGKGGSVRNLKSYWSKMIFTGQGNPPLTAGSTDELKSMIARDNSIGVSTSSAGLNVIYTIHD